MIEPTGYAAVAVALIAALVTLWTQRGGARAQRRTAVIEERALGLEEFKTLREAAMQDLALMRTEVADLRAAASDVSDTLALASDYIKAVRPMVPMPPGPPDLPEGLRRHRVGE